MSTEAARQGEAARTDDSTSPALSSPSRSPDSPPNPILVQSTVQSNEPLSYPSLPSHDSVTLDASAAAATIAITAKGPPAVKRPRKKRDSAANPGTSTATEVREKRPRKPRAPPGTVNPTRRKVKAEPAVESKVVPAVATQQPRQSTSADVVGSSQPPSTSNVLATPLPSQNGKTEAIANDPPVPQPTSQSTPRSGQNYDPIRSSTVEAPKQFTNPFGPQQSSPLKRTNRASASPSISSLIDPPDTSPATYPFAQTSSLPMSHQNKLYEYGSTTRSTLSPPAPMKADTQPRPVTSGSPTTVNLLSIKPAFENQPLTFRRPSPPSTAMDLDPLPLDTAIHEQSSAPAAKVPPQISRKLSPGASTPSSATHSPKPSRPKEKDPILPPLLSGNGLLSSALFGGPIDSSATEKLQAPTVILHVPLNGESNKYVNFAQMAEQQYGFNALHPRLAAQRERLARVAAAGALLEKASSNGGQSGSGGASADDMSVELSEADENGDNSSVEMGGMGTDGGKENPLLKPVKRRRMMKEDQYDKEDPFVDDTELAWEEQAAASKDGFFVYSGPLVPEGEKPQVERADGPVKRGRGRGRGGTTRGTGSSRGGAAGGGTTGTRGTGTIRKPRVTKAARLQMEQEKTEREKMAVLVAKPSGYAGPGVMGMPQG